MGILTFDLLNDACGVAKKKARFGHRVWLIWSEGHTHHAAPQSAESVERACAAIGDRGKFFCVYPDGLWVTVRRRAADIMLKNAQNGLL